MTTNQKLFDAAKEGNVAAGQKALIEGADVEALIDGKTPLDWSARNGHLPFVKLLLVNGVSANQASGPLHFAAWNGHADIIDHLLQNGAEVNQLDKPDQRTPLHWAAAEGHVAAIKSLLEQGADPNLVDAQGQTPSDLARRWHPDLVPLFNSADIHPEYASHVARTRKSHEHNTADHPSQPLSPTR